MNSPIRNLDTWSPGINSFDIEVAYKDTRYNFGVVRLSTGFYRLTLNGQALDVQVAVTAEGALLATFSG